MTKKRLIVSIVLYIVIFLVVAALVAGNILGAMYETLITSFLDQTSQSYKVITVDEDETDTDYYKSDYATLVELQEHEEELAQQIQAEGSVLLVNNGALPFASSVKNITLLGRSSAADDQGGFQYGGAGAGSIDTKNTPNLKEAFEDAGYTVNPTLWAFYNTGAGASYTRGTTRDGWSAGEVPQSAYTSTEINSFASYDDAAIVVIARPGQEGSDLSLTAENGKHSLEFSDNELALIEMANQHFDTVIVLLNTMNAMELGPLTDSSTPQYNVDACLWIGAGGQMGVKALPDILSGARTPSGRLTDTYAYDALSAPAMQNFGRYTLSDGSESIGTYVSYAEGIYIGYRYYETRYADKVLGTANVGDYDYTAQVQFPFGYGLSYSEFEYANFRMTEGADEIEFSVTVTNTSATTDKAVVEIYMQSPYTEYDKANGIEKSAVELVGFAKTGELGQNQSETVTVSVPKEYMRAWDSNANGGAGGYIVEAGEYYFAFGTDAHDALNNILAEQGKTTADGMDANGTAAFVDSLTVATTDSTTYNVGADGEQMTNQYADIDMATYDSSYTYLSRSNWTGTWPAAGGTVQASASLQAVLNNDKNDVYTADPDAEMPATGTISAEYGQLTLASVMELEYDDPAWDALVSQMTASEMEQLFRVGGYGTIIMNSVGKPATVDKDGPAGISSTLVGGAGCFGYPVEVLVASTWNLDLAEELGRCVGEDGLYSGTAGWYAPAMNIHRTPFSGRNFEYYSEDGVISGLFGAATTRGAQSKGVFCYMKHYALNDQEAGRSGICTFSNEQATREIYLRPFEYTVRYGDCLGVMVGMNRVGPIWAGAHEGLMTVSLRNEWGFKGIAITDQASTGGYYPFQTGLINGLDLMLNTNTSLWALESGYESNATLMSALHRASKNILYTVAHSHAMNGIAPSSKVVKVLAPWQIWLIVVDVVVGLAAVAGVTLITVGIVKAKKKAQQ